MQTFKRSHRTATGLADYTQMFLDLLSLGQTLYEQPHGAIERLGQEVMRATQGRAKLLPPHQNSSTELDVPFPVFASFPVWFRHRTYGKVHIASDPAYPTSPALPLHVAEILVHICSYLLYTLELSAFIEGQCQGLDYQIPRDLTNREREVLTLICRGYNQQAIATTLHIVPATVETHLKHIRQKFGVHSERDLLLAAYQANLCPILEGT
jgi:DNA-binding CsgD family transcriptional regulator